MPEEYTRIHAAKYLGVPVWELTGHELDEWSRDFWTRWALIAMEADIKIQDYEEKFGKKKK